MDWNIKSKIEHVFWKCLSLWEAHALRNTSKIQKTTIGVLKIVVSGIHWNQDHKVKSKDSTALCLWLKFICSTATVQLL